MQVCYKSFDLDRPFGVEIEVGPSVPQDSIQRTISDNSSHEVRLAGGWTQTYENTYWHIKQDSSCGPLATTRRKDYGWEIASYKAAGIKDILHIADITDRLSRLGVEVNNNCGLHVHAQISDFRPEQAGIMLARWIKIEPVLECLVAERRRRNIHCRLWSKPNELLPSYSREMTYTGLQFWQMMQPTSFSHHGSENPHKRVALNFVNYASALMRETRDYPVVRKTVEIRLPESILSGDHVANWVKLFLLFVESCKTATMPENLRPVASLDEFFQMVGLAGSDCFYLLSKGMNLTKRWVLRKIIDSPWVRNERVFNNYLTQAAEKLTHISTPKFLVA